MSRRTNNGYVYQIQVDTEAGNLKLLEFLCLNYSHSSRAEWAERLGAGELFVNNQLAAATDVLRPGMLVAWHRPSWTEESTPQSYGNVFEDEDVLIVDKPRGLPTLPGGGFLENTLLAFVRKTNPKANPVHRLGRGTSGLVLFAKTKHAASVLSKSWPATEKRYLALGTHVAKESEYDINTPIGIVSHPRLGSVHAATPDGKKSRSVARVEMTSASRDTPGSTLFNVLLCTGRPHQIRIHLASIGHPLVGDPMYGVGGRLQGNPGLPGDGGYYLHASTLEFLHPTKRDLQKVECDPPEEFASRLNALCEPLN